MGRRVGNHLFRSSLIFAFVASAHEQELVLAVVSFALLPLPPKHFLTSKGRPCGQVKRAKSNRLLLLLLARSTGCLFLVLLSRIVFSGQRRQTSWRAPSLPARTHTKSQPAPIRAPDIPERKKYLSSMGSFCLVFAPACLVCLVVVVAVKGALPPKVRADKLAARRRNRFN